MRRCPLLRLPIKALRADIAHVIAPNAWLVCPLAGIGTLPLAASFSASASVALKSFEFFNAVMAPDVPRAFATRLA